LAIVGLGLSRYLVQGEAESTRIDIAACVSGRRKKFTLTGKLLPLFARFFALLGMEALILRAG
jgi:hypothetical protein